MNPTASRLSTMCAGDVVPIATSAIPTTREWRCFKLVVTLFTEKTSPTIGDARYCHSHFVCVPILP
jgi:hypothetical protein